MFPSLITHFLIELIFCTATWKSVQCIKLYIGIQANNIFYNIKYKCSSSSSQYQRKNAKKSNICRQGFISRLNQLYLKHQPDYLQLEHQPDYLQLEHQPDYLQLEQVLQFISLLIDVRKNFIFA